MTPRAGVIFVHGIGNVGPDFADIMKEGVKKNLNSLDKNAPYGDNNIAYKTMFWGDILQGYENRYLNALKDYSLRQDGIRNFVVRILADATLYTSFSERQGSFYKMIHTRIHSLLTEMRYEMTESGQAPDACTKPLFIVACSLGSVIMTNYIWDIQKNKIGAQPYMISPLEKMETLSGILTIGSNIPLFALNDYNLPNTFPKS